MKRSRTELHPSPWTRQQNVVRFIGYFTVVCACLVGVSACSTLVPSKPTPRYLNTSVPFALRAKDLVARMTLEEKVGQMVNQAPAIERLGIPEYNWWSEGLHGVARAGLATVFPQAIGLAASWDEDTLHQVATAIGDEARAKHHGFAARDKRFLYQGLTLWSPNINIFRDPRWGRGQETYGEDPFLTGRLAVQFIRGLQGDDPHYLKTVATVKHFAVHSGPEPTRHAFNAITDHKDLYETYLPQFEMSVKEGGVQSLMCAYNRYNGKATCGSDFLLQDILREEWQFPGFVVSDCGAILDFHEHHKLTQTAAESAALAVKAGTDLNCGNVYLSLVDAVSQGLISETDIDTAVIRLFTARFQLGLFDRPEQVPYAQIPYSVVDSPEHQALARLAAQKSLVLLKNDHQTLPLSKNIKSLAVIGPNSDQWLMLLGNYNGVPSDPITPLRGIREKVSDATQLIFAQGSELADGIPMLYPIGPEFLTSQHLPGLATEFFNNTNLQGAPLFTERHPNIDANWHDQAPRPDMDDDHFAVRWTGELTPKQSGEYQIGVITTCNTNVYLDGQLIASTPYHFRNEYGDPRTKKSAWISLQAGKSYQLKVEAIETYADAQVQLVWAEPKPNLHAEAIKAARQADAVVMFMGLTPRMEGEEMDIAVEGFLGGDRTKLALPETQQKLIKDIHALGKPVVLVVLNGSALALNWEQQNIPAILEAWYPGQAGGQAIADVLFGDYNPAGRLPVTFYHSENDLPAFDDYNITTQTYRYFPKQALYPFGYGLSYSTFEYSGAELPSTLSPGKALTVTVTLTNTSDWAGEEVAQVYVASRSPRERTPLRTLIAFKRIHLDPRGKTEITFDIPADAFTYIDAQGHKQQDTGEFEIAIGGGQPHQKIKTRSNVLLKTIRIQ